LTAERILRTWKLDADLVTLSACETGLGKYSAGEGFLGFPQALFRAGTRSMMLSLWPVDDTATALLMVRFYENLLGKRDLRQPMSKAEALREAKTWLRSLTADEIRRLVARLPEEPRRDGRHRELRAEAARPYAHPVYWSAFILIGDLE